MSVFITGLATNSIFSVSFLVKKIIDLPGGKMNTPLVEEILFSSITPRNSLISFTNPFFELTRCLLKALDLPCTLPPELKRYKVTVKCTVLGVKSQGNLNLKKPYTH